MTKKVNEDLNNESQINKQVEGKPFSLDPINALLFIAQKNNFKFTEPLYNSKLLKESRVNKYKPALEDFKKERAFKELTTDGFDIDCFHYTWLKAENTNCDKWKGKSNSDNIEIFKYQSWVINEMKRVELKITSQSNDNPIFNWNHSDSLADSVYNALSGKNYISSDTTLETFKIAFGLLPDSGEHQKIKWTCKNKTQPHKSALRDFLTLASGQTISQKTVDANFVDSKSNRIELNKPKKNSYSNHIGFFEGIFKG
jgi:hypothetical protein